MAQIHRSLTPDLVEQIKLQLFPFEQLIKPTEFRRYFESEQRANEANEAHSKTNYPGRGQLALLNRADRDAIKANIERFIATQDVLFRHFQSWADRMAREITGDHDRVWRHVHSSTVEHVERIEELLAEHGKLEVIGLSDKDHRLVSEHIKALRTHLQAGGRLGFWIFRAQAVKDALYIIQSVKVNGKPCRDIKTLDQLASWMETSSRIGALADLWKGITTPPTGDAILQCSTYRDLCKPIEQALALHDQIQQIKESCRDCPGVRLPAWHSQDEVKAFYMAIEAVNFEEDYVFAQHCFAPLEESLKDHIVSGSSHKSAEQLLNAVVSRDCALYQAALDTLSTLHIWKSNYNSLQIGRASCRERV